MSLSYQLEILWYQAERMRSLGWAEYLSVQMSPDRKTMKALYWTRPPVPMPTGAQRARYKPVPLFGGTLTIAIESVKARSARSPEEIVLARIQQHVKLGNTRPSDEVEPLKLSASWEPSTGVLAVNIPPHELTLPAGTLTIVCWSATFPKHYLHSVIGGR